MARAKGKTPGEDGAEPSPRPGRGRRLRTAAIWVAAVAILGFCAFGARSYWQASNDEDLDFAATRDEVLEAGEDHLARLNTLRGGDADAIGAELDQWLEVTTGPLHDELERTREESTEVLVADGSSTTGTVTDAAVTQLDQRAGTARLIATLEVETTPRDGDPSTDRRRLEAGLSRTDEGWRVTSLTSLVIDQPQEDAEEGDAAGEGEDDAAGGDAAGAGQSEDDQPEGQQ